VSAPRTRNALPALRPLLCRLFRALPKGMHFSRRKLMQQPAPRHLPAAISNQNGGPILNEIFFMEGTFLARRRDLQDNKTKKAPPAMPGLRQPEIKS